MRQSKLVMASLVALVPGTAGLEAHAATGAATRPAASVQAQAEPERILGHVRALTGSEIPALVPVVHATAASGDPAAEYIAGQFRSYRLLPAGDDGTYFQAVPMTEVRTLPETSLIVVASDLATLPLRNLEDIVTHNETQSPSAYVDAPIVFVGYGIQAPEYGWDDYKDVDLSGKVALLLANEPLDGTTNRFQAHAPTHFGSPAYKFAEAARRGAVAALIIEEPSETSDTWNALRAEWATRAYWRGDAAPRLAVASCIQAGAARRLAGLAGLDLDALLAKARTKDFTPVELPLRLQAHVASEVRAIAGRNVLAALPGRGGSSHEAVLYTARYDRLGSDVAPGTNDFQDDRAADAAGVAVLLEAARLWSQRSAAPPRTILFAALAAENHGQPAADRLVTGESAVPPGRISLALNYEPQATGGDARAVLVRGAARTSFEAAVAETAKALGLTLHSDPYPGSGRDYASGAYQLALAGVPSLTLAKSSGRAANRSHPVAVQSASDATLVRLGYELGVQAASEAKLIAWRTGDEFDAVRKRSELLTHAPNKPLQRKSKRVR